MTATINTTFLNFTTNNSMGPLKVSSVNSRYFAKPDGTIVFLTGSHTWTTFQDRGTIDPPPVFDFNGYINYLSTHGHNWMRLWCGWEQTYWNNNPDNVLRYYSPGPPYKRTGPGNANDGKLKFDLTQFEQAFFDRVRTRVLAARVLGIYCQIMLFDGFSLANGFNSSNGGFPHQSGNNINSVAVTDIQYNTLNDSSVTARQDLLIQKYVDTVSDCDNVLWEICNEPASSSDTFAWEAHVIAKLHTYEISQGYMKHPVVYSSGGYPGYSDAELLASNAEAIARVGNGSSIDDTDENTGIKVLVDDSDHDYYWAFMVSDGVTAFRTWPFRRLCKGGQAMFMDPWFDSWSGRNIPGGTITGGQGTSFDTTWNPMRNAMTDAANYANRINLKLCIPYSSLSTTGHCIANPGIQYIALQTSSGAFDLTMIAGNYSYEWFDITNRVVNGTGGITVGSGAHTFTPPFSGAALLLLIQ